MLKMKLSRRVSAAIAGLVVMSTLSTSIVFADENSTNAVIGLPGFWSAQTIQNIDASGTTITGKAYQAQGASGSDEDVKSLPTSVGSGSAVTVLPKSIAGSGPNWDTVQNGSMVFSANAKLAAIVSLTNQNIACCGLGVAGGTATGVYEGTDGSSAAPTLNFPIAKNNSNKNNTVFFVQNAGNTATEIKVQFKCTGCPANPVSFGNLDPNRSLGITADQMPSGSVGSAVVTNSANQPLAGATIEIEAGAAGLTSKAVKAGRALAANDFGTTLYAPAFKKGFGVPANTMAIGVQGDSALAGKIEYTCSDGACTKGSVVTINFTTAAAGETYIAWPYSADHASLPDKSLYSAKIIITTGKAVSTVGETGALVGKNEESLYVAVSETQAKTTWYCPVYKELYFDGASAGVIFPISYPAKISAEFTVIASEKSSIPAGTKYKIKDLQITSGSAVFYDLAHNISPSTIPWDGPAMPTTDGLSLSMKVTSDKGIVVTSNEAIHFSKKTVLDGRQYNCFPG